MPPTLQATVPTFPQQTGNGKLKQMLRVARRFSPLSTRFNACRLLLSTSTNVPVNEPGKTMLPVALARHRNIALGVKKMSELARLVRGLSCEESIIQMSLSDKKHSVFVKKCIQNAVNNAVNNLGLDAHRLVVKEVLVSKGIVKKKIRYHGKGHCSIQRKRHSHLTVKVSEQPFVPGERKIGIRGRLIRNMVSTRELRRREAEKASGAA